MTREDQAVVMAEREAIGDDRGHQDQRGSEIRYSVLLPTFNSERFVRNAIESVLEQTSAHEAELLVVDDGSSDRTPDVVRAYEGERVSLTRQDHAGTAAARNTALARARGEVVVLLDHDDELHPRFLERVGAVFEREPDTAVVFPNAYLYDDSRDRLLGRTLFELQPLPGRLDVIQLIRGNYVLARAAIRRDVVNRLGGFDETVSGSDDYALWLRVAEAGLEFRAIAEPLVYYRLLPGSQGSDRAVMAERYREILERAMAEFELGPEAEAECRLRIAAAQERTHMARATGALRQRSFRAACAQFGRAWRVSPLRWRSVRVVYFLLEAVVRRGGVERAAGRAGVAKTMRTVPPPEPGGPARLPREAAQRLRRALAWETAAPRRSALRDVRAARRGRQ